MEIKSADIQAAILEADDFGFEMRVGNILSTLASKRANDPWNATDVEHPKHGGTYTDEVTGKPRQFDFRCRIIHLNKERDAGRGALLAIECKNLFPTAPLIVCGRPRSEDESYYHFMESRFSPAGGGASSSDIRTVSAPQVFYKPGDFVGKSPAPIQRKAREA